MTLLIPNKFAMSAVEEQMVTLENNTRGVGSFFIAGAITKGACVMYE